MWTCYWVLILQGQAEKLRHTREATDEEIARLKLAEEELVQVSVVFKIELLMGVQGKCGPQDRGVIESTGLVCGLQNRVVIKSTRQVWSSS